MRRYLAAALVFGVFTGGIGGVRAQGPGSHPAVVVPKGAEEVWQLEAKRRALLLAGDLDALSELCSDEMTYSHTNGLVDNKTSYFKMLRSGARYVQMDLSDVKIARYDSTVVITGVAQVAVNSPNGRTGFRARFTDVWAKQQDRWRFVAWQTTRMPD